MKFLFLMLQFGCASAYICFGSSGFYECTLSEACCPPGDYTCMAEMKTDDAKCNYDGCSNTGWPYGCRIGYCFRFSPNMLFDSVSEACPAKPASCPATTYSLNSRCIECPANHFCPGDGFIAHACTPCAENQFTTSPCNASHNTGCSNCSFGMRHHPTDLGLCVCKPGFIRLPNGQCEACWSGYGSDADDRTTCTRCWTG